MKLIPLTRGQFAMVDDSDYEWLNQWKWMSEKSGNRNYAIRFSKTLNGRRRQIRMHRLIMNTPIGQIVDHKNFNGLDCQRKNMRNCSHSQNRMNRKPYGKSRYLGVSIKKGKYITAVIKEGDKHKYLGSFKTEEAAARAYDAAAKAHHGEFANLNFKD